MGLGEVLLILAVALVVVGPKKLPEVARLVGRGLAEFRRHADDVQRTIQRELHTPLKADDLLKSAAAQVYPGPPPAEATAADPTTAPEPAPPGQPPA